jgi:hypothetical protein
MTDAQRLLLCEALMHLEVSWDEEVCTPDEADLRVTAAHYLVQECIDGHRPANYNEVVNGARALDAKMAADEAIRHAARKRE